MPTIIYLNGPSSSGKTQLALALREALEEPFLHIGIDRVIGMMPQKMNDWTGGPAPLGYSWAKTLDEDGTEMQELILGPFAQKIQKDYQLISQLLAKLGHHLIIDDVNGDPHALQEWKTLLHEHAVIAVGVTAPLHVIEERERSRGNRMIGSARCQYKRIHFDHNYDLIVDTHANDQQTVISQIINILPDTHGNITPNRTGN